MADELDDQAGITALILSPISSQQFFRHHAYTIRFSGRPAGHCPSALYRVCHRWRFVIDQMALVDIFTPACGCLGCFVGIQEFGVSPDTPGAETASIGEPGKLQRRFYSALPVTGDISCRIAGIYADNSGDIGDSDQCRYVPVGIEQMEKTIIA